jgi:hypothetical protein
MIKRLLKLAYYASSVITTLNLLRKLLRKVRGRSR